MIRRNSALSVEWGPLPWSLLPCLLKTQMQGPLPTPLPPPSHLCWKSRVGPWKSAWTPSSVWEPLHPPSLLQAFWTPPAPTQHSERSCPLLDTLLSQLVSGRGQHPGSAAMGPRAVRVTVQYLVVTLFLKGEQIVFQGMCRVEELTSGIREEKGNRIFKTLISIHRYFLNLWLGIFCQFGENENITSFSLFLWEFQ